jgi:hypothetical protein
MVESNRKLRGLFYRLLLLSRCLLLIFGLFLDTNKYVSDNHCEVGCTLTLRPGTAGIQQ